MLKRTQIQISGIVQGVGFRPFLFALAAENSLKGRVLNNERGVFVDVEGESANIERFIEAVKTTPPPLSFIESVTRQDISQKSDFQTFEILASETNGSRSVPVSPDIATCADCLREMFDSKDRRFGYPFINCTNCGPRFTIIENMPYDRVRTTMRGFEMCAACRAEYENPLDRRFHAEPTCCPACGPQLFLADKRNADARNRNLTRSAGAGNINAVSRARKLLTAGKIIAVKGIGGFHLVCDALNATAVETLRKRKHREDRPLALMANAVETIEKFCFVSDAERALLLSKERPIVVLEKRKDAVISQAVAPRSKNLGFMLPYAPLHFLLLEKAANPLVMTSGNVSDEPICHRNGEASERLKQIADYFLFHDRTIHIRTDDSVVRVLAEPPASAGKSKADDRPAKTDLPTDADGSGPYVLRRSRGYAPAPIRTSFRFERQILACGAELKNTFCLTRDDSAFLSHHIGDLKNLETLKSFAEGIEHYKRLFDLAPEIIAYDLHPDYLSTKYALDTTAEKIGIQHHHAHVASCLADNLAEGEVIGVAMDGTGFGLDGKIWGGEFFIADFKTAERIAHLDYIRLPGGAKAIREPWRVAAAYLEKTFGDVFLGLELPFVEHLDVNKWRTLQSMIAAETNCPQTSSMGRLFDAVASLLGLRDTVTYEGQAAIELEAVAERGAAKAYRFEPAKDGIIKSEPIIRQAVEDLLNGISVAEISARFHLAVAYLIADVADRVRAERGLNRVALSGGVFQNMFLLASVCRILKKTGFEVLTHRRVPTNDGGISLGQAAIANAQCQSRLH